MAAIAIETPMSCCPQYATVPVLSAIVDQAFNMSLASIQGIA